MAVQTTLILCLVLTLSTQSANKKNPFLAIFANPFEELAKSFREASKPKAVSEVIADQNGPKVNGSTIVVPANAPNEPCPEEYRRDAYGKCRWMVD